MKNIAIFCSLLSCLSLSGCSSSSQPPVAQKDTGRAETKTLEAATAAGYNGKAVRNSVDSTLNKNEDHIKDINKQAEEVK